MARRREIKSEKAYLTFNNTQEVGRQQTADCAAHDLTINIINVSHSLR